MRYPQRVNVIYPTSKRAKIWLSENKGPDSQWVTLDKNIKIKVVDEVLVGEYRFVSELIERMKASGLTKEDFQVGFALPVRATRNGSEGDPDLPHGGASA